VFRLADPDRAPVSADGRHRDPVESRERPLARGSRPLRYRSRIGVRISPSTVRMSSTAKSCHPSPLSRSSIVAARAAASAAAAAVAGNNVRRS
jgi:hypothetical protein